MDTFFRKADAEQQPYREQWLMFYRMYRAYLTRDYAYKQSRILPIAFSMIMTILPRLLMNRPRIQYLMRDIPTDLQGLDMGDPRTEQLIQEGYKMEDIERARERIMNMYNYVDETQWSMIGGDASMGEHLLINMIYGSSPISTPWDRELNAPGLDAHEPFEFYPDAGCRHPRKLKRYCRRFWSSKEDIKEMFDSGAYHIKSKTDIDSMGGQDHNSDDKMGIIGKGGSYDRDLVEVLEYYDKGQILTRLNGTDLVRAVKNKYEELPHIFGINMFNPGEFWGMSEIDQIESLIADATDFRAIRLANLEMQLMQMFVVDITKKVYTEDLIVAPMQMIRVEGGTDAIKPMPMAPTPEGSFMEDQYVDRMIRQTTGVSEYSQGTTPQRMEMATTVGSLIDASNSRFNYKLQMLTDYVLVPMGRRRLAMNQRYLTPFNFVIPEKDSRGRQIRIKLDTKLLKTISGQYDVNIIPGHISVTNKEELYQMMQLITTNEALAPYIDPRQLLVRIFKMFNMTTQDLLKSDAQVQAPQQTHPPVNGQPVPGQLPPGLEGIVEGGANLDQVNQAGIQALMPQGGGQPV